MTNVYSLFNLKFLFDFNSKKLEYSIHANKVNISMEIIVSFGSL